MTTVLLIRHGQTSANANGVLAGRLPGVTLDATGRRQARTLGRRLRDLPLAAIVHSPLERCVQTARIIADAHDAGVALHVEDRLTECDYGLWAGNSLTDLAEEPLWSRVQASPSDVTFPGGESMAEMAERADAAIAHWTCVHPEQVLAIVSHGDVIKAVLSRALGQPFDEFQRIVVGPGSVSVLRYGSRRPAVVRMNDTGPVLPIQQTSGEPTVGGGRG